MKEFEQAKKNLVKLSQSAGPDDISPEAYKFCDLASTSVIIPSPFMCNL